MYIEDIHRIFNEILKKKRKTSKIHKLCLKLLQFFNEDIDVLMRSLGYCCGQHYSFLPQVLSCYGQKNCSIPRNAKYWSFENRCYCIKCFSGIHGDTISIEDDPTKPPTIIKQSEFCEKKNDHLEQEAFVTCLDCLKKSHKICVLHLEEIYGGFTCENCLKAKGKKKKENTFTSESLPKSKLGNYMEERVFNFLKKNNCKEEVIIRIVSSSEKCFEVKPFMKARYVDTGKWPQRFPFQFKVILAFQKIDETEVCIFSMHVQEYGSKCPRPNLRNVYIAYLDSVPYFNPKHLRTEVYQEILLGYLGYLKHLGYSTANIWACPPPSAGDDYIFHCHPAEQKMPQPKRLQKWYMNMLNKGLVEGIVEDYKNIYDNAKEKNLQPFDITYFEGDFWPDVLEQSIKELEQAVKQREEADAAAAMDPAASSDANDEGEYSSINGKKKGQKSGRKKKSNKSKNNQRKNNKKSTVPYTGKDLSTKIYSTMEKHKESFFVINLQSRRNLPPILDSDPLISCTMIERLNFLDYATQHNLEFSTLRRAKFSTLAMLYQLHKSKPKVNPLYNCQVLLEKLHFNFDVLEISKREKHVKEVEVPKLDFKIEEGVNIEDEIMSDEILLAAEHVNEVEDPKLDTTFKEKDGKQVKKSEEKLLFAEQTCCADLEQQVKQLTVTVEKLQMEVAKLKNKNKNLTDVLIATKESFTKVLLDNI